MPASGHIHGNSSKAQRGIALVSVLWVMALVALVATGLAQTVRSDSRAVANVLSQSRAQWAADAGVELAALNLMYPVAVRWPADGSVREIDVDGVQLRIATLDVAGRIDLNTAPPALLTNLITQAGMEANDAAYVVGAILDWRDVDQMRRLNGAEANDYRLAGRDYEPGNGPFQSVDELRLVLGMTDEIYSRLEPAVTVFSGEAGIKPLAAPPLAMNATSGLEYLRNAAGGSTFDVLVEAVAADGIAYRTAATIRMEYGSGRPYTVLAWRSPEKSP